MNLKKIAGGLLSTIVALSLVATPTQAASFKGLTGTFSFVTGEDNH